MDTNVFGMAVTFQPFVAPMRARASGTLVGIASVAGFRGLPGGGAYSASKSAAITYLESLRVELRGSGVAVVTPEPRSEEHTSELQSRRDLVCRLLLEKKKKKNIVRSCVINK